MGWYGIVTFASFTCQPRGALEDRMEENQRFRELAIVANPLEIAYSSPV
jgi:hypothetical protein